MLPTALPRLLGASALLATLLPGLAAAGEFAILPLRVDLGAQQRAAQVAIRNDDSAPLRMQVRAMRWSQDAAGKDLYELAEDLIYFPRAVEVPPGESRIVRLGVRAAGGSVEDSYRLFFTELPPAGADAAASGASVRVVLEVGVPVFVAPLKREAANRIDALSVAGGVARWTVRNTGNIHLRAEKIEVVGTDAGGRVVFTLPVDERYVLAQVQRPMQAQLPPELCPRLAQVTVVVSADGQQLTQATDVAAAQCR